MRWYVAECYSNENFPYVIRDEEGKAVALVMSPEDARRIVEAINREQQP